MKFKNKLNKELRENAFGSHIDHLELSKYTLKDRQIYPVFLYFDREQLQIPLIYGHFFLQHIIKCNHLSLIQISI